MVRYPLDIAAHYNPQNLSSQWNIFTTVYLGNYTEGDFREGVGSHAGVDIIPAQPKSPVYAVLPGVVFFAGFHKVEGNCVVVKHTGIPAFGNPSQKEDIFSCYLHLSDISVQTGQKIDEGSILGTTGNTGAYSTAEHLHFQIDRATAPFHPYWPFTYQEAKNLGLGFMAAVSAGLGLENAKKYTLNPLVYLDQLMQTSSEPLSGAGATLPSTPSTPTSSQDLSLLGAAASEIFGTTDIASSSISETKPAPATSENPTAPRPQTPVVFTDVPSSDAAIAWIAAQGIATGFEDHTFRPKNPLTRAEFLKLSFTFLRLSAQMGNLPFSDVDSAHWSAPYIATAYAQGWVRGYADGFFRPNATITRAEAVAMLLNMAYGREAIVSQNCACSFVDIPKNSWMTPYIGFIQKNQLMTTFPGQKFLPNNPMLRLRMAELLYNLHTKLHLFSE